MSIPKHAAEVLRAAEASMRDLARAALEAKQYRDVAELAQLADALADLIRGHQGVRDADVPMGAAAAEPVRTGRASGRSVGTRAYPHFRRDNEKLVKVGWSKKDRREYEHRVPHRAVLRIAERINEVVPPGRVFRMDRVLPVESGDGGEIPSYQAYVALAWFRALGAVEERGKDGFAVANGGLTPARLEQAWRELP